LFSVAFARGQRLAALGGRWCAAVAARTALSFQQYLVLLLVIVCLSALACQATLFVAIFNGIVDTAARTFCPRRERSHL